MKQIKTRNEFFNSYEHSEIVADGQDGETIYIPGLPPGKNITLTIIAGSNSGKFQFVTSLDSEVINDEIDEDDWQDWSNGVTTGSHTEVIISAVSAIRGVSVSGEIKIEIKI